MARDARLLPGASVVEVEIGEAAARARVHRKTLERWCRLGYILARRYPSSRVRAARWLVELDPRTGRPAVAA